MIGDMDIDRGDIVDGDSFRGKSAAVM